ncbi:translation metalloprotein YbeY [Clostridium sp. ATCC 29733]|nr:translation metalloprotein YbeY [Clostridium sp. ATCC 29733]
MNMALVKVSITNRQKKVKLPSGLRLLVRRACNAVLTAEKFAGPAEVSVTFVDNEQIQELNAEYRGKDISTDVLSFPLGENGKFDKNRETGAYVLGDVVISAEKAVLQAEIYGHSLQREIAFLTVHSMLHILGYDHVAGGMEQVRMREKEEAIMLQLGLPRDASYVSEE